MLSKEQSKQIGITAGMNASYDMGAFQIGVNAGTNINFSNSSSQTDGFNQSESIAKEVVQSQYGRADTEKAILNILRSFLPQYNNEPANLKPNQLSQTQSTLLLNLLMEKGAKTKAILLTSLYDKINDFGGDNNFTAAMLLLLPTEVRNSEKFIEVEDELNRMNKAEDVISPAQKLKNAEKMWENFKYSDLHTVPPKNKPCFLAGTLIKTDNGLIPIEEVKIGANVLSYNIGSNKAEYKEVTEIYKNFAEKYIVLQTSSNNVVKVTGAHLFYEMKRQKWIQASKLKLDMKLMDSNGNSVGITSVEIEKGNVNTYNLEVAENHNYFVGETEILTHNKTRVSKFASKNLIEVSFYRIVEVVDENTNKSLYVGQTIQEIDTRFSQHRRDRKKASWRNRMNGVLEIKLNGISPPYKMTHYEAAVVEMYEINLRGGDVKKKGGLFNKQIPISEKKFMQFKTGSFNPCKFYV